MLAKWVYLVFGLNIVVTIFLFYFIVKKKGKTVDEWAFLAMLGGFFGWVLLHNGFLYLKASGNPYANTAGTLAGLSVQIMAFCGFIFCEHFPRGARINGRVARNLLAAGAAIPIALMVFSEDWISNTTQPDGAIHYKFGLFFYVHSAWIVFLATGGMVILAIKYSRASEPRIRLQIRHLLFGMSAAIVMATVFSVVLPVFGFVEFIFLGTVGISLLLFVVCYTIIFHHLFDIRLAAVRYLFHWFLSLIFCGLFYIPYLFLLTDSGLIEFSWLVLCSLTAFFFIGLSYGRFLQKKIERSLFPDVTFPVEDSIGLLRNDLLSSVGRTIVQHMQELLAYFCATLQSKKGFLIIRGQTRPFYIETFGLPPATISSMKARRLAVLLNKVDLPAELLKRTNRPFLLDNQKRKADHSSPQSPNNPYLRLAEFFLAHLREDGYALVLPLVIPGSVNGCMVFGYRKGEKPFYQRELRYMETVRLAVAHALGSHLALEDEYRQKNMAEAEIEQLTEFVVRESFSEKIAEKSLVWVGKSMERTLAAVRQASSVKHPVLITGETGTGKELVARLIHNFSARKEEPFVEVNLASIPASLWEDELFGHVRGAFTDARSARSGRVATAGDGTLFMDELGEVPVELQAKLLRFIQEKRFTPVGGDTPIESNCRLIFATNQDLEKLQEEGRFRLDLYHRINILPIHLPPLRERSEDIPAIVKHFIERFREDGGSAVESVEDTAMQALVRYTWPGNVRELENLVIRLLIVNRKRCIQLADLPPRILDTTRRHSGRAYLHSVEDKSLRFDDRVDDFIRAMIRDAIQATGGNKTRAAELLQIKRNRMVYQMKQLGMED